MKGKSERFGGELPLDCDRLADWQDLPDNVYGFSHGRAAISWFIGARGPFESAAICAYTCPTVPQHLASAALLLGFFDYGADHIDDVIEALPGRCLVLVPAPFGLVPWLDATSLARRLGERVAVMIDAAQTAFGALDFPVPAGGAVLSCPRKALAIGDGALLAVEQADERERETIAGLPTADRAIEMKQKSRALFAEGKIEREAEALALARQSETLIAEQQARLSDVSRDRICRIDRAVHRASRQANALRLSDRLKGKCELGLPGSFTQHPSVPFNFPILHDDRVRLLSDLHARRVFATPLWPNARHDPLQHPRAADFAQRLLALPVDQRYQAADMDRLADIVETCL